MFLFLIDKYGIELIVTNQMEITPFDTIDFFVVIGNLLDNAIEILFIFFRSNSTIFKNTVRIISIFNNDSSILLILINMNNDLFIIR